jgi:hypothetical protein
MTDQELLAYQREHHGDPYMTLAKAKKMQRVALQFWHVGAAQNWRTERPWTRRPIARTLPSQTRSDSAPSVSSMSVAGSRRCL